jgi:hypothetical protein
MVCFDGITSMFPSVMAGLVPAIHDLKKHFDFREVVDARHKVGHDAEDADMMSYDISTFWHLVFFVSLSLSL